MPAQKSIDRERFMTGLKPLWEPGAMPPTYSNMVFHKMHRPATLARVKDPKVLAKLADQKRAGVYFNQVMKGQSVDFVVLGVMEEVAREYQATKQLVEA